MQRSCHLPRLLQDIIELLSPRQSPVEEDLRQALGKLLGDGRALTERRRELNGTNLAARQHRKQHSTIVYLRPFQLFLRENVTGADCL